MSTEPLFDVVAVDAEASIILWIVADKTKENADAVVGMAVMRQGIEDRFYSVERAGKYKVGDTWGGPDEEHDPTCGENEEHADERDSGIPKPGM